MTIKSTIAADIIVGCDNGHCYGTIDSSLNINKQIPVTNNRCVNGQSRQKNLDKKYELWTRSRSLIIYDMEREKNVVIDYTVKLVKVARQSVFIQNDSQEKIANFVFSSTAR